MNIDYVDDQLVVSVVTDNYQDASIIQLKLENGSFVDEINESDVMTDEYPESSLDTIVVDQDIVFDFSAEIDVDESGDLEAIESEVMNAIEAIDDSYSSFPNIVSLKNCSTKNIKCYREQKI